MMNLLQISTLYRVIIFIASGAIFLYSTTCSFAASATDRVSESRHALVECINMVFPKLAEISDLKPVGVAYFVGLNCGEKRDTYAKALRESNIQNSAEYIKKIDAIAVHEILKRLSVLRGIDNTQSQQTPNTTQGRASK